ncbi:MAG: hypothetical protein INR71_10695, partial [Terriglobus roseus]|nr:hypothetical protein [Terriglobus roseus]
GALCTVAQPPLCWRPYELLPQEEERLRAQRAGVDDAIDRELDAFEDRRRVALRELDEEEALLEEAGRERAGEQEQADGDAEARARDDGRVAEPPAGPLNGDHASTADAEAAAEQSTCSTATATNGESGHDKGVVDAEDKDDDQPMNEPSPAAAETAVEPPKDVHDDGGEVVEGDEDTVIY